MAEIKGKAEDFWSFIKEFELIGLTETWLVGKEEAIARRKLEEEYEIELVAASKEIGKGRPKQEIILAMKKGSYRDVPDARRWKGKEFIDREVRKKQGRKMYVGVTYMRESRKENREMMEEITELARNEVVIIGRDYNVKTKEEVGSEIYKKEKGARRKVINKEGEEFLEWLENTGLSIVKEMEERKEMEKGASSAAEGVR